MISGCMDIEDSRRAAVLGLADSGADPMFGWLERQGDLTATAATVLELSSRFKCQADRVHS